MKISEREHAERLPVTVVFGGVGYALAPLNFRRAQIWVSEAIKAVQANGGMFVGGTDAERKARLEAALQENPAAIMEFSVKALNLVFEFAGEKWSEEQKEAIDAAADYKSVFDAFGACMAMANPTKPATSRPARDK